MLGVMFLRHVFLVFAFFMFNLLMQSCCCVGMSMLSIICVTTSSV